MTNLDSITNENNKKHNEKWRYIPDHPYWIIIIGGSGSRKTNALSEPKYEYLIKKRKDVGIKHVNNPDAFIECSNTMDDVYENIDDYNSNRKRKFNCFWWHDSRYYDK